MSDSIECPICTHVVSIVNRHHIIPKCYGGDPKGPLLDLCENCHKSIHYTAEAEYSNKKVDYLKPLELENARPYIEAIKKSKDFFERTIGKEHLLKKVIIEVTQNNLIKMHKRKASLGFSSLEKYLHYLIQQDTRGL